MEEKNFDAINSPLEGTILIEASAGTGKTYTITSLYLRFIIEKRLDVHQILVITFTEAATAELRSRIRKRLIDALRTVKGEETSDAFLNEYLTSLQDKFNHDNIGSYLERALRSFDRASIYTIHGFCSRIINDQPFMSRSILGEELITDIYELRETVFKDFIRIYMTNMSPLFLEWSKKKLKIKELMSLINPVISNKNIKIFPDTPHNVKPDYGQAEKNFMESFKKLHEIWGNNRNWVKNILCSHDKNLDRRSYRPDMAKKDIMEIDRYCLSECCLPPNILEEKYMSSRIAGKAKNSSIAENPFFVWCENHIALWKNLENIYDETALWLKKEFVSFIGKRFESEKSKRNLKTFDDLLNRVDTLSDRFFFAKAISDCYHVAIIDEFQDTDEIQWNIVKNIFQKNSKPLFLIGDPKQAIYSFRGADIFSYLSAAKSADNIFTLCENWRSEPGLISAINALFSHENPFINKDIHFIKARPADSASNQEEKYISGDDKTNPFVFWFADNPEKESGKTINKSEAADIVLKKMRNEMLRLLNMGKEGRITVSGRQLNEKHMAVLVRSHGEAQRVLDFLEEKDIKGAIYGTESVFNSYEASELEFLLNAVANPNNMRAFIAAMGTELMGVSEAYLINFQENQSYFEKKLKDFSEYREQWITHGFISMFSNLVSGEGILTRLAGLNHGKRRLTNLRHLMELLHNAETEEHLNMDGLINWLSERREIKQNSESEQLRLDNDDEAILIITMHKSKGLEFPVVFIPFPWSCKGIPAKDPPSVLFHKNDSLYLDMGPEKENLIISKDEILAENIRLFYVALTRAKNRCYTAWGKVGKAAPVSAPAWLFHNKNFNADEEISPSLSAENILKALTPEDVFEELKKFEKDSGHTISVSAEPVKTYPSIKSDNAVKPLSVRSLNKEIDTDWRISSFSSMSKKPDFSENHVQDYDSFIEEKTEDTEPQEKAEKSIFSMPKGAVTGNIFHEIFESYDFMETNEKVLPDLVEKKCAPYGYENKWNPIITETVRKVVSAPLCTDNPGVTLSKVSKKDRLSELSFYFPMEKLNAACLKKAILNDEALPAAFKREAENLSFVSARGFMNGYIDLIFRADDKFYIVDWKSNHLGDTPEDYYHDAVMAVMAKEQYFLQYYIYTAALDKYLSQRIKDYDYSTCFGGVFYIFLRGVGHSARASHHGIFRNKPSHEAIKAFNACF